MAVISAVLSAANVIFFAANAAFQIRLVRYTASGDRWLRYLYIVMSVYWTGLYLYILLYESTKEIATPFGQVFVRPAFTFTAAIMLAGAIYRYRGQQR